MTRLAALVLAAGLAACSGPVAPELPAEEGGSISAKRAPGPNNRCQKRRASCDGPVVVVPPMPHEPPFYPLRPVLE